MNKEQFNSLLHVYISDVIREIIEVTHENEDVVLEKFMHSRIYELLSKEETKMWHYSSKALCQYYLLEQEGCLVVTEGL